MNEKETRLELIRRYLEGTATAEETRHLETLLLSDAGLRREFLRYAHLDAALAERRTAATPPALKHRTWMQWRPLTAAAAGIILGMFCTSLVFAYASPRFATTARRLLWNEGFELGVRQTIPGLPNKTDGWFGDEARVVDAENGVQPKNGSKMLRFLSATFAGENAKQSIWGDVYRLVDLRGQIREGRALMRVTANFNGTHFPAGEEYSCDVELCALEEELANAPQPLALPWVRENSVAVGARKFSMKGDGLWQEAVAEVPVSPQTRCVLVHLAVLRRKPFPPAAPVTFNAHYLDEVKLELLSLP